jgi:hypothetical protein
MKMNVIVDKMGNVVGAARVGSMKADDGTKIEVGVIPEVGQTVYELDVSDELMSADPDKIQHELSIQIRSKNPYLPKLERQ